MPTIIRTLSETDPKSHESLHRLAKGISLDGECYAFALALHDGLGWPIVGLMLMEIPRHAAVRDPEGRLHDVRGFVDEEDFGEPFGFHVQPLPLREIPAEWLWKSIRPVSHRSVARARKMAEALWPELPWKQSTAARVAAFADELEALCRKHKLWIRSPVPAQQPVIAQGEDDEGGYTLQATADGMSFLIDRYLK